MGQLLPLIQPPSNPRPFLTDRTSIEVDWECGMKYWWYKLEGGKGVVPTEEAHYFLDGRLIHEDLLHFAQGKSVEEVLATLPSIESVAPDQIALEKLSRRIGWITAYGLYIEPQTREMYDEVMCEEEILLTRGDLNIAIKPDRVLRGKVDKRLVYREYKSAKYLNGDFLNHWPYASQLHLGMMALEDKFGERVAFSNILAFYKGMDRDGRLIHPYVWAYRSPQGEWTHEYHYGWEKVGVWEYPEGVEAWVRKCGEGVARKVFLWSPPVFLNERMVESLVRRRVEREREIREVKGRSQGDLDFRSLHFEERFTKCKPSFGDACPYLMACWNKSVGENVLGSGVYKVRTPHHDIEVGWDE